MKKVFFAALAATFMFASCNKEDNGIVSVPEGQDAKLVVNVNSPASRATGLGSAAGVDNVITGYEILVFNAGGDNVGYVSGTATTQEVATKTSAIEVYVVANAPAGLFSSSTTKSTLLAYTTDLNVATGNQRSSRWATGTVSVGNFAQIAGEFTATASVTMDFIAARITVTIDNQMTGYNATATDGSFVLKGVSVLNATSKSLLYGTSLAFGSAFYSGISMTDFSNIPATYTVQSFLRDPIIGGNPAAGYHFYVFENAATSVSNFPTIVVIEGEYDGKAIYFPIHLTDYEAFTGTGITGGVLRGNSYNLTFSLTGDARFSEGGGYPGDTGGTEDPTIPSSSDAKCTVSLSINDWTPVTLVKEF